MPKYLLRILIITFLCVFFSHSSPGADNTRLADSLRVAIKNAEPDSLLLDNLYTLVRKNRRDLGPAYLDLLKLYSIKANESKYPHGTMKAYDRIGLQYRFDGKFDSALFFHRLSLQLAEILNDSVQLYYNYNNIGQVYRMQDLSVQAINNFHQALSISRSLGDNKSSSFTYNAIGATYVVQKDYTTAMEYFRESEKISLQLNDKKTLAYNYGAIGEVFLDQEEYDSAMFYLIKAKELKQELNRASGIAVTNHLIGRVNFAKGEYDQAESYFEAAVATHEKYNNTRYLAMCYAYLGQINSEKGNYNTAEGYLLKAQVLAQSIHSYENLLLVYDGLSAHYRQIQQWEKAIKAIEDKNAIKDSIISIANSKQLQSLEIEFETQKKEQKIQLLSAENKIITQRNSLSLVAIIALGIGIFSIFYVMQLRKKHAALEKDKIQQQLMLSQMNPHFIFNVLGSIQSFMYKNDAKKAAVFLGNFSSLTRSILLNSSQEFITLDNEVSMIRNYLELEKMRMNKAFEYSINLSDNIDTEFINIPPMMLQPFVENSIKHGLKHKESNGLLSVNFIEHNDTIEVEITDNGVGLNNSEAKSTDHQSMATKIFKQRLTLLRKRFKQLPEPEMIDLSEKGGQGTQVVLFLPIIS